jgi:Fur family ferric uptake transcriptional regulator
MTQCSHSPELLPKATERLRREARKITGPRQAILEALHRNLRLMTRKEIFAQLARQDCNLATVYRSVRLLEELGLVKRYDFGDGIARYELKAPDDSGHHHHLVCARCASVVKTDICIPPEIEERIARESGYCAISHRLEFFGLCPQCAEKR